MNKRIPNLYLENAEVLPGSFRNFAGKASRYNKEGNRNFNIVISDEKMARRLINDGWNLHLMKPRGDDENDAPTRYKLNVTVSYRYRPPEIHLYSGKRETLLDEETIGTLDYADYSTADLTIRPRPWIDDDGSRKIKAYLAEMRVVIQPNRWDDKYARYMNREETDDDDSSDLPF